MCGERCRERCSIFPFLSIVGKERIVLLNCVFLSFPFICEQHRSSVYFYLFFILFRSKVLGLKFLAKCQENRNNGMNRTIDWYNNTLLRVIFLYELCTTCTSKIVLSINFMNRESKETELFISQIFFSRNWTLSLYIYIHVYEIIKLEIFNWNF